MKKFASLTLALLMVLATLAGCGASAPAKKNDMAMEAPMAPAPEYALDTGFKDMTSVAGQSVPNTEQKLIKTVQ